MSKIIGFNEDRMLYMVKIHRYVLDATDETRIVERYYFPALDFDDAVKTAQAYVKAWDSDRYRIFIMGIREVSPLFIEPEYLQ
jgi:hypothetical protein